MKTREGSFVPPASLQQIQKQSIYRINILYFEGFFKWRPIDTSFSSDHAAAALLVGIEKDVGLGKEFA